MDMVSYYTRSIDVDGKHYYDCDFLITSNKIMKLDDVEKVHPMKQIAVMSVVQFVVLGLMGVSMYIIGVMFK